MDLAKRHTNNGRVRRLHLPIEPSNPHPDNQVLLKLDDRSATLRKKSYIKTEKQYTISYGLLRKYDQRSTQNHFLSKASYRTLVEYVQFAMPTPLPKELFLCGPTIASMGKIRSSVQPSTSLSTPLLREHRLPGSYPCSLQTTHNALFLSYGSISGRAEPVPRINYHGYHYQYSQGRDHHVPNTDAYWESDGKFCGLNGSQWVKVIVFLCVLGVFFYGVDQALSILLEKLS
jgi:hypothetical protein